MPLNVTKKLKEKETFYKKTSSIIYFDIYFVKKIFIPKTRQLLLLYLLRKCIAKIIRIVLSKDSYNIL